MFFCLILPNDDTRELSALKTVYPMLSRVSTPRTSTLTYMFESDREDRTHSPFVSSGVSVSVANTIIVNAAKINKTMLRIDFSSKIRTFFLNCKLKCKLLYLYIISEGLLSGRTQYLHSLDYAYVWLTKIRWRPGNAPRPPLYFEGKNVSRECSRRLWCPQFRPVQAIPCVRGRCRKHRNGAHHLYSRNRWLSSLFRGACR